MPILGWLAVDGAIDRVDHGLGLDEFEPRPLGLVAVERRGQRLGEGVAVLGHALARLFQSLKSLVHGRCFPLLARLWLARKVRLGVPIARAPAISSSASRSPSPNTLNHAPMAAPVRTERSLL